MLDGEEYLNSDNLNSNLSSFNTFVNANDKEVDLEQDPFNLTNSLKTADDEQFQKSKESVYKELDNVDNIFIKGEIPNYREVNTTSLHASYLAFRSAFERALEAPTKNNLDAFGVAHKIFADERTKLQKSQEIEKNRYKNIFNRMQKLLQDALDKDMKFAKQILDTNKIDEYMYKDFWSNLGKDIISILKEEILNQKNTKSD